MVKIKFRRGGMGKVASLDIETFCPIEELEEGDVTYLKGRKDYSSEEDFHRDLSTNPYVSLLLSFSLFLPEEGVAYVFYLGEEESEEISRVNIGEISIEAVYASLSLKKGISESESRLVELFWKQLEQIDTLVTFYGKDFDMEFLKIRTLIHGVKSPAFYRYFHSKSVNHIDLRDVFRVGRNHYSLNFISRRMKLPIDKGDMDGSKIRNVFLKGEYRKVADYNLRDALLTGMLYERVKDHLYHNHVLELVKSAGFSEGKDLIEYALDNNLLSGKETSVLIDFCKGRIEAGPSDKQVGFLRDLIKAYNPEIRDVCALLGHETIQRIVKFAWEEEIT
ncbi:MAG: ribonuclease H-like domain-containing protein [Aquificaceae bacterium]|jgi:hypothetical protein|uniref:ribonuclease H-like domain-containing protein n=1 Tax=Hydrogenobacter sp. Uz 6-8 TaxID=3384828 RepID=UPI00309A7B11